ncbi:MAG: septal ring lytic transglycosylase RlpA family protein [Gammaproteobacteria bacterium]|nr:septal ring lytic transglycosylase RlpA family protein [Gammaproteobacteria bacterium]
MLNLLHYLLVPVLIFTLSACSSTSRLVQDGPPNRVDIDLNRVSDATPRAEPRARYGNPASYQVYGVTYVPLKTAQGYREQGFASWYGTKFHGVLTSSREPYDMYAMTAAHKTLPLPTYVRVTNLSNNKSVIVRVNDRGPFHSDRIIDLSYAAAYKLDMLKKGTAPVLVETIDTAVQPIDAKTVYLQVGAFDQFENAEQMRQKLLDAKISSGIKIAPKNTSNSLYRVQLGPFTNREQAMEFRAQLARYGVDSAHVVSD